MSKTFKDYFDYSCLRSAKRSSNNAYTENYLFFIILDESGFGELAKVFREKGKEKSNVASSPFPAKNRFQLILYLTLLDKKKAKNLDSNLWMIFKKQGVIG